MAGQSARLVILGATGSVGRSTLAVVAEHRERFPVEAVAAYSDAEGLAAIAREFGARLAVVADPGAYRALADALAGSGIEAAAGEEAVVATAASAPADIVVAAIAGTAGMRATHAAVREGRRVALANKECLVCAGSAFMRDARAAAATVLPVDSEHNAIFQALGGHDADDIDRMILTASGGPFRDWPADKIAMARPEEALAHPNWSMGAKITVDSASLMNKGLEVIEAHHLFGVPARRLGVLIHRQSIVHGLVTFRDGSVTAGLAMPDMRVPIAHCLGYPERLGVATPRLDLAAIGRLDFAEADIARFPALGLALAALEGGGSLATVMNAANEVAVAAFLGRSLPFGGIARVVEATMARVGRSGAGEEPASVDDALAIDVEARAVAREFVMSPAGIAATATH
jgi:1-deoxy-D-xylulose-5-phosphate reductoisomerase